MITIAFRYLYYKPPDDALLWSYNYDITLIIIIIWVLSCYKDWKSIFTLPKGRSRKIKAKSIKYSNREKVNEGPKLVKEWSIVDCSWYHHGDFQKRKLQIAVEEGYIKHLIVNPAKQDVSNEGNFIYMFNTNIDQKLPITPHNITKVDIEDVTKQTVESGMEKSATGAAVGGLLFGKLGAITGSMIGGTGTSKTITEKYEYTEVRISFNDNNWVKLHLDKNKIPTRFNRYSDAFLLNALVQQSINT